MTARRLAERLLASHRGFASALSAAVGAAAALRRAAPALCVIALLVWTSWLHLLVSLRILQWDSHVFMLMGRWWLDGIWPYRDAWELKPPGIFVYLAGLFAILPDALWSVRIGNWLLACASAVAAWVFLRRQTGALAGFLGAGAWSYWSTQSFFVWGGVYTELYAATAVWIACASASRHRPLAAGAAVAVAVLFKHPAATVLLPVAWLLGRQAVPRLLIGFASVSLAVVAFAWLVPGMWQPFVECNWTALVARAQAGSGLAGAQHLAELWASLRELAARFSIACLFAIAGVATAPAVAVLWFLADTLGVMAQRGFHAHYWVLAFPSAIWIASTALRRPLVAGLAVVILVAWLPGEWRAMAPGTRRAWHMWTTGDWPVSTSRPFEEEVGHYVRARTAPAERISVIGWNATGLGIYWSAERLPASRHFFGLCCDVPQETMLAEVERDQPSAVVLLGIPDDSSIRTSLTRAYALDRRFTADYTADVWLRKHDESGGAAAP